MIRGEERTTAINATTACASEEKPVYTKVMETRTLHARDGRNYMKEEVEEGSTLSKMGYPMS